MKAVASPTDLIDVQSLRIGMVVQLDGGWMSHPFPVSRFRIASADQIATIRSLGLAQVKWDPAKSDPPAEDAPTAAAAAESHEPEPAPVAANDDLADPRRLRDRELAALRQCERQFGEAAKALRQATDLARGQPREARAQAEALTSELVGQMLVEGDLCVRLLGDRAGDKASQHALNVTLISLLMGRNFGLGAADMLDLGVGAMLHDIGKIEVPDRLRHADDRQTPSEAAAYRSHVELGVAIGRRMGLAPGALQVLAQHHEHADGGGFPIGLNTDRMSAPARIVALVNRYDNLCNPYLSALALTPHEALAQLFAQDRTRIDTSILSAFIKMMGVYPPGSTVQLTDDRYAIVVGVNSSRPLKPRVLVHEPGAATIDIVPLDLEAQPGLGIRRSIKPLQLPPDALAALSPRQRVAYFFEPAAEADTAE